MKVLKSDNIYFFLLSFLFILTLLQYILISPSLASSNSSAISNGIDSQGSVCFEIGCGIGWKECAVVRWPGPLNDPYTCYEGLLPLPETLE